MGGKSRLTENKSSLGGSEGSERIGWLLFSSGIVFSLDWTGDPGCVKIFDLEGPAEGGLTGSTNNDSPTGVRVINDDRVNGALKGGVFGIVTALPCSDSGVEGRVGG